MSASESEISATQSTFALPLVVAITGHRDLKHEEIPGIRERVVEFFDDLDSHYPDRPLCVVSPLAEGSDRLVAEVALERGMRLTVPLPMAKDLYTNDFPTTESRQQFESLCERADEVFELPLARGNTIDEISMPGAARDRQYAQVGVFLCAHCHILLAIWDGKPSPNLGGTAQVVRFHHDDVMPGYTPRTIATQQMLVDDESDLVYHIVCSRDRHHGEPHPDFLPLQCFWFTKDRKNPRVQEIPSQHLAIFGHSTEFSRDAIRYADRIESGKYSLLDEQDTDDLPRGIDEINRLFCIADWLAIHYQKKTMFTLRATHLLAFLMGFMFILYSDFESLSYYMFAFLSFFLVAAGIHYVAKRDGWQRRYLDYRTLAEGLRVQFYWAAAGVVNENESKFTHDNYLQTQDPELGWIRNVMRVAGTRCDAARNQDPAGLRFALREWIGNNDSGQLGYFRRKAHDRVKKNRYTERLGLFSLLTSVGVVILFIVAGSIIPDYMRDPMMVIMGTMLLLFGVRQGYAYSTAEKELIKQYEFMLRIFLNARRRLDDTNDIDEQRQVLLALGGSALDEHAEWILMHRDRSVDQGEIWRMGS